MPYLSSLDVSPLFNPVDIALAVLLMVPAPLIILSRAAVASEISIDVFLRASFTPSVYCFAPPTAAAACPSAVFCSSVKLVPDDIMLFIAFTAVSS